MSIRRLLLVCLVLATGVAASEGDASKLYKEGRKAEREGDVVRAYLLYSQAAALDPQRPEYWLRGQALRTRAALKARPLPKLGGVEESSPEELPPAPAGFSTTISDQDLEDLRRLKPPPELKATPGEKTLDLRGDAKSLFDQAARAFGLGTAFDRDYEAGPVMHVRIDHADYREALHTIEAATGSFVFPIGDRLLMVAKDTQQKRAELEPTVAVTIPIPDPVTVQEAQEMARAVQQTMEIIKFGVDGTRRMVLIRDRVSKVLPARALFEELAHRRPRVAIELQFLEVDRSTFYSYGFLMPTSFPIVYVGRDLIAGAVQPLGRFLFGHTVLGLGIANAQLLATMTRSTGHNLLRTEVQSVDGQPASFHVGDKYPILTGGFLGTGTFGVPPAFSFEDLGLVLKVTPHVHGTDEMTLEVNAEFKLLAGQSLNAVPIISDRQFESKVRLKNGEWAVMAGLMSTTEARTISGLAGLSNLPLLGALFRRNDLDQSATEVLLLLKPRLLSLPPSEYLTRALYLGSEGRLQIPL